MRRIYFSCTLLLIISQLSSQSVSATYTSGDISTNYNVFDPTCNGPLTTLTITLPGSVGSYNVTGIDIQYNMTALNGGWMADQRSQIHCQNSSTTESIIYAGAGSSGGTFPYNRPNVNIANGLYPAGTDLIFEMRAWRVFGSSPVCGPQFNKVDNNTWTITVYYQPNCAVGNFNINNQTDVDNFIDNYGACGTVTGSLTLNGTNTFNSSGLSFIDTITDYLFFEDYSNSGTPNIEGFNNLEFVLNLGISTSTSITDLSAFSNLNTLSVLQITGNSGFINLSGLPNITVISWLRIIADNDLVDLTGLENITALPIIEIAGNTSLTSLNGLDNLNASLDIYIDQNPVLTSLNPFPNLTTVDNLEIKHNNSLNNQGGFESLQIVNENLNIYNNDALIDFFDFTSLETVYGNFSIDAHDLLETINSLDKLYDIHGNLSINSNTSLNSIEFLSNVKYVAGDFFLLYNSSLSDCCPINNIVPGVVSGFTISNNNLGCNSILDIDTTCIILDPDQDGILSANDNCPNLYNPNQEDNDSDNIGNACDNCPLVANTDQADANDNFIGDACESPASQVHMEVESQELFVNNNQKGLILTDPNGNCYRLNIDLEGNIRTTSISCP